MLQNPRLGNFIMTAPLDSYISLLPVAGPRSILKKIIEHATASIILANMDAEGPTTTAPQERLPALVPPPPALPVLAAPVTIPPVVAPVVDEGSQSGWVSCIVS